MRIGTWNVQQAVPPGPRASAQRAAMEQLDADVWLLTEVHLDVAVSGHALHHSDERHIKPKQRWSAVSSRWPINPLPSPHVGLAMTRIAHPGGTYLAACSVMPWRGAGASWPGEATGKHGERFAETLAIHLEAIQEAAGGTGQVIWGGDFNQALEGRETAGSLAGRALLLDAFEQLGLSARTGHLSHRIEGINSIDHVAIPSGWSVSDARMVMPTTSDERPLSDHAAYVVDVQPD